MKPRCFLSAVILCTALFAKSAAGATFNTVFSLGENFERDCDSISTLGAITSCTVNKTVNQNAAELLLQTREELGSIGIRASLRITEGQPSPRDRNPRATFSAGVSVRLEDTLSFQNTPDGSVFVLPVDLAGAVNVPAPTAGSALLDAHASFSVFSSDPGNRISSLFYDQRTSRTGTPSGGVFTVFENNQPSSGQVGSTGIQNLRFTINDGTLDLAFSLGGRVRCQGDFTSAVPCEATVDFLNSARLLGATVEDATGSVISNATISSSSGFDYATGVQPHSVSAVPLPAGVWFFGTAILALFGLSRRNLQS